VFSARFCGGCGISVPNNKPISVRELDSKKILRKVVPLLNRRKKSNLKYHPQKNIAWFFLITSIALFGSLPIFALSENLRIKDSDIYPTNSSPNINDNRCQENNVIYSDVPIDHPVYRAWSTLIEDRITLHDETRRARPFDSVKWSEWNNCIKQILNKLGINRVSEIRSTLYRTGNMNSEEIRLSCTTLAKLLSISESANYLTRIPLFLPTRLEALAVLANIFKEKAGIK